MFEITAGKGFAMTFENGNTISVQFGEYNYCSNKFQQFEGKGKDAEIAIWNSSDVWFDFGGDQVKGWVSADEVADWISKAKNGQLSF